MKIKKLSASIVSMLFAVTCLMSSCLDNEVVEYTFSSNTSITSFSLGTLKVKKIGKYKSGDKEGQDSIYYENVDMSGYPFTIDQTKRSIENKDSLPIGTDISKVITNITGDTQYIQYGKIKKKGEEAVDTLWTNTDSIDFSVAPEEGLKFYVTAASGVKGKPYYIKVNVHSLDPDSLKWFSPITSSNYFNTEYLVQQKAVFANSKIFVFGKDKNNNTHIEYTTLTPETMQNAEGKEIVINSTPSPWEALNNGNMNIISSAIPSSALLWQNKIYFISDNTLYTLNPENNAIEKASEHPADYQITQLIAGIESDMYPAKLYARSENGTITYTVTPEGGKWTKDNEVNTFGQLFTEEAERFASATLPVSHNNTLARTIVMGYNSEATPKSGVVYQRLNSENKWISYNYEQIDTLGCPNIKDLSMIYYNKKLYAFGGEINSEQHKDYQKPFSALFKSEDNGLTWKPDSYIGFPIDKDKNNIFETLYNTGNSKGEGSYSSVADNNHFIWVIWHDGSMSHGRINHLGFAPKW